MTTNEQLPEAEPPVTVFQTKEPDCSTNARERGPVRFLGPWLVWCGAFDGPVEYDDERTQFRGCHFESGPPRRLPDGTPATLDATNFVYP